jgi:hypothetical protein
MMNKLGIVVIAGLAFLAMTGLAVSENNDSTKADASEVIKLPEPRTDGGFSAEMRLG